MQKYFDLVSLKLLQQRRFMELLCCNIFCVSVSAYFIHKIGLIFQNCSYKKFKKFRVKLIPSQPQKFQVNNDVYEGQESLLIT